MASTTGLSTLFKLHRHFASALCAPQHANYGQRHRSKPLAKICLKLIQHRGRERCRIFITHDHVQVDRTATAAAAASGRDASLASYPVLIEARGKLVDKSQSMVQLAED